MATISIDAVFDGGVLRPLKPLNLPANQRVSLLLELPPELNDWPSDVAEIYAELAEEDRQLAAAMWPAVQQTWPGRKECP